MSVPGLSFPKRLTRSLTSSTKPALISFTAVFVSLLHGCLHSNNTSSFFMPTR